MRVRSLSSGVLAIVPLFVVACAVIEEPPSSSQGRAEISVDTARISGLDITVVTVEAGGVTHDITRNPVTGKFDGALFLPAGSQTIVARAFAEAVLVGQSNPIVVGIQPGSLTRVSIRILDVTGGGQPAFGPIIESVSFPSTAEAGQAVTFTASVIAPAGDPVAIEWSDDCDDSVFLAPSEATTGWTMPAVGTCRVFVTATSNEIQDSQSFTIAVFTAGSGLGALHVDGAFVEAPLVTITLGQGETVCFVTPESFNASCPNIPAASPDVIPFNALVSSWGGSVPGTFTISDNCGGRFSAGPSSDFISGFWLPPTQASTCLLTAHAVSGDGVHADLSAAVRARAGTPRTAPPPAISVSLFHNSGQCQLSSASGPVSCGFTFSGTGMFLSGAVGWGEGLPGTIGVSDDCGTPYQTSFDQFGNMSAQGTLFQQDGPTCTVTVEATNFEGATSQASGLISFF